MSSIPRIVISAPSSGHGKTAVSVGVLAALAARGLRPSGFKIGPDFVDAAYLGLASGRPGRNLDPRLVGSHRIAPLFAHGSMGSDIAVVEGTMGLYDGLTSRTDSESTAQIAGLLRAPVILVVDVAAMGQSAAALVHGFRTYDELLWLGGVVLTRTISSRHEHLLRESLADIGVPVLGALRRRDLAALGAGGAALPPREHGLAPAAHRNLDALRGIRRLGELISNAVDLERVLMLARSAPRLATDAWSPTDALALDGVVEPTGDVFAPYGTGHRPVIAVASAYGYAETPELLAAAGAEIVHIDPLRDDRLPDRVDALVVPGGLPEAYTDQLSANTRLRGDVLNLARTGRPIIAEGAGMVWLGRDIDGLPMCGVLDTTATTTDRYVVGYREAAACMASVVHGGGDSVTGHKLHRTNVSPRAGSRPAWVWAGGHPEGFIEGAVHASYLSLHWAGVPRMASRLVSAAAALSSAYSPPHPITSAPPSMAQSWALPAAGTYRSPTASVTPALPPPYVTDGDDLPPLEPWAPEIPPRVDHTVVASAPPAGTAAGTAAVSPAAGPAGPAGSAAGAAAVSAAGTAAVSPAVTESTPPVGVPVVSPLGSTPPGDGPASAPASPAPLTAGSVPTHDPEPLPVDTAGWPRLPALPGAPKPDAAPAGEPVSAVPVSSTPVSATPVSATPVSAAPAAAPASSVPASSSPVSPAPSAAPASSVPASSAPVSAAPVSAPAASPAAAQESAAAPERADVAEPRGESHDKPAGNRPSGAEAV